MYVDSSTGRIKFDISTNTPEAIKAREDLAKSDNAPIPRQSGGSNYVLESLGIEGDYTVMDISDGFDKLQEGQKLVINTSAGSTDGNFNNRSAQIYFP